VPETSSTSHHVVSNAIGEPFHPSAASRRSFPAFLASTDRERPFNSLSQFPPCDLFPSCPLRNDRLARLSLRLRCCPNRTSRSLSRNCARCPLLPPRWALPKAVTSDARMRPLFPAPPRPSTWFSPKVPLASARLGAPPRPLRRALATLLGLLRQRHFVLKSGGISRFAARTRPTFPPRASPARHFVHSRLF